jgi:lipopolysaccharide export LptBFGC system permease protein LptF
MTDDKSTSNTQNKSSIKTSKLAKSVALDVSASASSDKTQTNEPSSTKDTITQKKEKQTFRQPTKNTEKHSVAVNNKISKAAVVALMLVILVIVAMFSAFFLLSTATQSTKK